MVSQDRSAVVSQAAETTDLNESDPAYRGIQQSRYLQRIQHGGQ